jgi:hypothetical protein
MKLYIGFSRPTGKFVPFAWLIQWVEARPYDHVYIRIQEPANGTWMVFQASSTMVNLCSAAMFLSKNQSLKEYEIEITPEQHSLAWAFINQNLGVPYSLLEDFGILLMKIFHLKNQPFNQGMAAEFCSKLGANVCLTLSIPIPEDASQIDPSALDAILGNLRLTSSENPSF